MTTATTTRRNLLTSALTGAAALALGPNAVQAAQKATSGGGAGGRARTGLESLAAGGFASLRGLKVGLVTNPTGVLPTLQTTVDALAGASGVRLRALFGPEHGVRGDVAAGEYVASGRDAQTGLPVYSLYGKTKVPTAAMLSGLDALVFDIQDIGSRSYTYLSTLGCVMEGAARNKIPLIVLDRPNPLGLLRVEGGPTQAGFTSFVGKYPTAYVHGMTLGELARMINGEGWLPGALTCDLTVVPCENLSRRAATWDAIMGQGAQWAPTSPHIPRSDTPLFYAATGIIGELPTLSIGVGYTLPFEMAGAPGVGPVSLARELERRALPGIRFRAASWTPFYAAFKSQNCGGVQIMFTDPGRAPLTRLNFELLDALRKVRSGRSFMGGDTEAVRMFDLSCGTDRVRKAFAKGASAAEMYDLFDAGRDGFVAKRKKYLLYEA